MNEISEGVPLTTEPAKPNQGMTSRVARGSLWSLAGQSFVLLTSVIATPFTIRFLGTESYGVLALINVLISYLTFSEFGMGVASTRFGSEAYSRGDDEGESDVVWTSMWLVAIPALLMAVTFALAARPLVEHALRLPQHLHEVAIIGLRLAAVGFFARAITNVLNTPQMVRLRMDLIFKINAVGSVGQTALLFVVLLLGGGLVGAVAVITGVSIITALLFAWSSLRLQSRLWKPRFSFNLLNPLLRFGSAVLISSIAALILTNGEKILLARYGSVRALAHYSVAFALAMILTQVPSAMSQSLLPALSRLQAGQDLEPLHRLSRRALHGTLFWVIPAALIMSVAAKPFLTLWAGPEFGRESTLPFYILAVGLIFNVMAWVPYNLLVALGRTGLVARFHLLELVPYILLTTLLSRWFGAVGASLAWTIRVVVTAPLFIIFAQRASGFDLSPLPSNLTVFGAALALLMLPPLVVMWLWGLPAVSLAVTIASVAGYAGIIWSKVLTEEERSGMRSLVPTQKFRRSMESEGIAN